MAYNRKDIAVQVGINTIKGYTMKEIGALDDRVKKLEYYTVLNALSLDTKTTSITNDNTGLERFKNGVFADPFNDDSIMNTQSSELNIAISAVNGIARPNYDEKYNSFDIDPTTSSNIKVRGRLLTLDYTSVVFGGNPHATTYRNCAETFYSFKGALQVYPSYDNTNINNQAAPQTIVNDAAKGFSDAASAGAYKNIDTTQGAPYVAAKNGSTTQWQANTTVTVKDVQVTTQTTTQNVGDYVKDVSVMPYMIGRRLAIYASHMKPDTRMYPFFDKQDVSKYCVPASIAPAFANSDGTLNQAAFNASAFSSDASAFLVQNGNLGDPLKSSSTGSLYMLFFLPANTFRAGERVFTLIDQPDITATSAILTSAEGNYNSSSLSTTKQNLSYSVIEPIFTPTTTQTTGQPVTWTTTDPPPVFINTGGGGGGGDQGQHDNGGQEGHDNENNDGGDSGGDSGGGASCGCGGGGGGD